MKIFLAGSVALLALVAFQAPAPAYATSQPVAAPQAAAPAADDMKERVKLATDFADIRPVRVMIDQSIQTLSERLPEEERERFMTYVKLRMDYDEIEALSIRAMADTFTAPELKAMIAYYGSAEGKSVDAKMGGYMSKMTPEVTKRIDAVLADVKFGPPSN